MFAFVKRGFRKSRKTGLVLAVLILIVPVATAQTQLEKFCDRLPRAAYSEFEKIDVSNDWLEVYEVETDVWAIYEPFQW
jgi:hypothetical protein